MKPYLLLSVLALPCCALAAGNINLQGTDFTTDTIAHYAIAPGTYHTHLQLTAGSRTVQVYAVTLQRDIAGATVSPRVLIGHDQCRTAESITSMAQRHSGSDRRYVAGINGDFFITGAFAANHHLGNAILGYPNMACAIGGEFAAPDMIDAVSHNSALIFDGEGGAWIDAPTITCKLLNNDGSTVVTATAMNYPRCSNELMVYNHYMGATTGTIPGGREIALVPAEDAVPRFNKSIKYIVKGGWSSDGNMAIPANGIVISADVAYANEFIDGFADGDIVKLKIGVTLPTRGNAKPQLTEMIGGDVRILNQGVVTTEAIRWINTPTSKYPRSLAGISADGNRVVMATADGGAFSSGVTYFEAADLMAALGCYDALDLDGGGSTALYMSHTGIANHPRDGQERAVGNGLYFAVDAPADNNVSAIAFADPACRIALYGSYTPVIYGYNSNGELIDTDFDGDIVLTAPEGLAPEGRSVTGTTTGCYALTATAGTMTCTIPVTVVEATDARIDLERIVIDKSGEFVLPMSATVDGKSMPLAPKAFEWTVDDPSVATVEASTGVLTAVANGVTGVTARRGDLVLTSTVAVEIAEAPFRPLVEEWIADQWKMTRSGVGADASFTPGADGSLTLDMNITNVRAPKLTLAKTLTSFGRPDRFVVDLDAGDYNVKAFNITLKAADAARPVILSKKDIAGAVSLSWTLADELGTGAATSWPVTFSNLSVEPAVTADGGKHCSVKIARIGFEYDNYESGVGNVALGNSEPAIFVDGATLYAPGAERVQLFNLAGVLVADVSGDTLYIGNLAHGVYVVRAIGNSVASSKIQI
ncbi:MAG: phosphodiester glycosidase family protein [Muribaculaceae bacterium]|nr:phosphodiester glycosidase family protein [Muribaculaceae bacterium]